MIKLAAILFLFPFIASAQQSMTDSTNIIVPATLNIIRFTTAYQSTNYVDGDSLRFRSNSSKRVGLVSPLSLPVSTLTTTALNSKLNFSDSAAMLGGYLRKTGSAATLTAIPVNQATGVLPFANGGISSAAATSATTGTMTVSMTTSVITITPTGACTFNASGGVAGQVITFSITTSGTTSFVLTFGSNFRKVGTLATGTVSARFFSVTFICVNGTIWQEISRTAVQT